MPVVDIGQFRIERPWAKVIGDDDRVQIVAGFWCPDLITGVVDKQVMLQNVWIETWEEMSQKARVELIRATWINALRHELDEWLRVDGVQVTDPHERERKG